MEGEPLKMELDTGYAYSVLPYANYMERFSEIPMKDTSVRTKTYLKAKCIVPDENTPTFFKARNVPYALGLNVDSELDRLEQSGVLSKVEYSE